MKIQKIVRLIPILLLLSLLCIIAFNSTLFANAKDNEFIVLDEQFDVEVDYGLNGIIKYGASIPISVQITNHGDDFEGTLRIISGSEVSDSESGGKIAYEHDVKISKGESQTFTTITNCSSKGKQQIVTTIWNKKEKLLFAQASEANTDYDNCAVVGLLSDDFKDLTYFSGLAINSTYINEQYEYKTTVVELEKETIPSEQKGLSSLNFLVINNFDTSQLSEAQCQSITDWVNNGGILIVGTGANASRTLAMFENKSDSAPEDTFLQVNVSDCEKGKMLVVPSTKKSVSLINFNKEHYVKSISIDDAITLNLSNITYDKELSFIQKKKLGKGAVVVTGFDLGMEPIISLETKSDFGDALLDDSTVAGTTGIIKNGVEDMNGKVNSQMYDLLNRLFHIDMPNLKICISFFVIYILVVGPIGYFILKKMKKRTWMWTFITTGAVAFTILFSIITSSFRITEPIVSHFTVFELQDNVVNENIFMAIQTPGTEKYNIPLSSEIRNLYPLKVQSNIINSQYLGLNNKQGITDWDYCVKDKSEGYELIAQHNTTFSTDFLKSSNVRENENCSLDVQLTAGTTTYFEGSVTNNTGHDLIEVFVGYSTSLSVYIGNLANGETKTFTAADNISLTSTYAWALTEYFNSGINLNKKVELSYHYIYEMVTNFLKEDEGIVFGYVPDFEQNLIADDTIEETGAALFYHQFTYKPNDDGGTYFSNIFDYVVNRNEDEIDFSDYMMCVDSVEMEFSFPITKITKIIRSKSPYGGNSSSVRVYAYNYQKGEFEEFLYGFNEKEFRNNCPYINKEGKMVLQFKCDTPYENYLPQLSIIGE